MKNGEDWDELLARQVSGVLFVDVRTVRKVLRGGSVKGLKGLRIEAEIARQRQISDDEAANNPRVSARPYCMPSLPDGKHGKPRG